MAVISAVPESTAEIVVKGMATITTTKETFGGQNYVVLSPAY